MYVLEQFLIINYLSLRKGISGIGGDDDTEDEERNSLLNATEANAETNEEKR